MNNTLIALHTRPLSGQPTEFVNARELHAFLEIGRDFTTWIKARVQQYSFEVGVDYLINSQSPKRGSGNRGAVNDYFITLDMAKELAMVERNEKGRQARRYFIDCERELKGASQMPVAAQTDKIQLINTMAHSMGLNDDVVIIPTIDVINMVQTIRGYQQVAEIMQRNPAWVNETIDRVKTMTGRNFDA
jgi:phage anti-repressor protein